MAVQPWQTGKVVKIEDATVDTRRYWIEVPGAPSFDFIPGQFVTLDLPIDEKPAKRWRSYSIASWPDGSNVFELLIVLNREGRGTPYLFDQVQVGSELTFRGPQGVFTLREPLEKDLFFICTGTGIAPFRSMLHYIACHKVSYQSIYLIFGCRTQGSLLYYDEMMELQERLPRFHYLPTLSREQWSGRCGYVHPVYEELCQSRQPAEFFLCGWKNMIDEAKQRIQALGYDKKAIHQELYG